MVKQFAFALGVTTCLVNVDLAYSKERTHLFTEILEGFHPLQRKGNFSKTINSDHVAISAPNSLKRINTKKFNGNRVGLRMTERASLFTLTKKRALPPFQKRNLLSHVATHTFRYSSPLKPSPFTKSEHAFIATKRSPQIQRNVAPFQPIFFTSQRNSSLSTLSTPSFVKPKSASLTRSGNSLKELLLNGTQPRTIQLSPVSRGTFLQEAPFSLATMIASLSSPVEPSVIQEAPFSLATMIASLSSPVKPSVLQDTALVSTAMPSLREVEQPPQPETAAPLNRSDRSQDNNTSLSSTERDSLVDVAASLPLSSLSLGSRDQEQTREEGTRSSPLLSSHLEPAHSNQERSFSVSPTLRQDAESTSDSRSNSVSDELLPRPVPLASNILLERARQDTLDESRRPVINTEWKDAEEDPERDQERQHREHEERLEQERERLENDRLAQQRVQRETEERIERERVAAQRLLEEQRLNEQRLQEEQRHQQELLRLQHDQERIVRERVENERLAAQQQLDAHREPERVVENVVLEQQEAQRLEEQRLNEQRLQEEQRLEEQRLNEQRLQEEQRHQQEQLRLQRDQERLERERVEAQRLEEQRVQRENEERLERERVAAQRLEEQRVQRENEERLERERVAAQLLEQQRVQRENEQRIERERVAAQLLEQQRLQRENEERLAQQRREAELLEADFVLVDDENGHQPPEQQHQPVIIDNYAPLLQQPPLMQQPQHQPPLVQPQPQGGLLGWGWRIGL